MRVGALFGLIREVLADIGVDVMMDANVNVVAGVMTDSEFGFRSMVAVVDCARVLQAWMPSYHV